MSKANKKTVLYAGDSPAGGPANYMLALLKDAGFIVRHVPPSEKLTRSHLDGPLSCIIFSDYSRDKISDDFQMKVQTLVRKGCGFMMVGGWGSFSGPFGHWKNSIIESLLPVNCLKGDDRLNFPSGALIKAKSKSLIFGNTVSFEQSPVICGINQVKPKKASRVILELNPLAVNGKNVRRAEIVYPLLVINSESQSRVAAFTTDFAPHWCGGLVDWGKNSKRLHVQDKIYVEVGNIYIQFAHSLFNWLSLSRNS